MRSGTVWRIRRVGDAQGMLPPEPAEVPIYFSACWLYLLVLWVPDWSQRSYLRSSNTTATESISPCAP